MKLTSDKIFWGCIASIILFFAWAFCIAIQAHAKADIARAEFYQASYSAWCKLEGRSDITYDEWTALRNSGVLTGRK